LSSAGYELTSIRSKNITSGHFLEAVYRRMDGMICIARATHRIRNDQNINLALALARARARARRSSQIALLTLK